MNGVFDNQTSGNDWTSAIGSMLHEREQEQSAPETISQQSNIIDNLECEMARYNDSHNATILEVGRQYMMPRDNSVRDFLNSHRILPQLLLDAFPFLQGTFPHTAVFALRTTSDEYGWRRLFVDALWPGDAADAYAAIDRFEDDWWVSHCHMASGCLNFTYRLV
jgi:hypothetical protein